MGIADEIAKLAELHRSGALDDVEFAEAKRRLLTNDSRPMPESEDSLGRAANRYVTFKMIWAIIGLVMFLFVLFGVILPSRRQPSLFPRSDGTIMQFCPIEQMS